MVNKDIRPYEISLWTLQDGFITVLKPLGLGNKGQVEEPQFVLKTDGTQKLTFKIPMYYRDGGELIENPIWYSYRDGLLIENLRKLKLIFAKGDATREKIFEFVITKITETHSGGQLVCEVESEGLAFQELGKNGYKLSFSQESFQLDYDKWWEDENRKEENEPIASIDYWAKQIFENTDWNYEVRMDWSSFDGVLDESERAKNAKLRQSNKIYEEEYIASWKDNNGKLTPMELVDFKEKARLIKVEKSNRYNITQTLAETFGVYCKYEYGYDENYHIISKTCVFYNNFLKEKDGKIDINYPYDGSKIVREKDSTDVITKMFVTPIESESMPSGLITIADVGANRSKEDYVLNFDYLYSIGTITQEQYDAIADYELSMYNFNTQLEPIGLQIANAETDLINYQSQKSIAVQGQIQDKEQMEKANALRDNITNGTGVLEKTKDAPYRGVLLQEEGKNTYYIKITQEGICSEIDVWYDAKTMGNNVRTQYTGSFQKKYDEYGNVVGITGLTLPADAATKLFYLAFSYRPNLYYENIYNSFAKQLSADLAKEKEADNKIAELETTIKSLKEKQTKLLADKQKIITNFENMMGPALREGSWQADTYTDYGERHQEEIVIGSASTGKYLSFTWDTEEFDGEQLNYFETFGNEGQAIEKNYYICIDLSNVLDKIKNNLANLSYIFHSGQKQCSIGSQAQFAFLRNTSGVVKPVLFITDDTLAEAELESASQNGDGFIGLITSTVDETGVHVETTTLVAHGDLTYIVGNVSTTAPAGYDLVYPRLVINSLLLKTSDDVFAIKYNEETVRKYYDYSILSRDERYYITLKGEFVLRDAVVNKKLKVSYELSNAALALYLDALEVAKTNAYPQVSYEIDVSAYGEWFIREAYNMLARIANINDASLKFENVQGYISELALNLNQPWNDKITIQNYKTKFEDLFSSIVASTEDMKANSYSYGIAAGAFTAGGSIKQSTLQNTINKVNLNYAFNNGNLTIDELNGIWATSENGVVAIRGGGIFCANQKDGNGNWLWNTGITPSGINANLLTAGQIDTNLIRIFAGDDLRFQLNADGLYAFKNSSISGGEADYSNYVVHNSEGLFLTNVKDNGEKINRVEISWDGLILRNNSGDTVFNADNDGNLTIVGNIQAATGKIGGWDILEKSLQSEDGTAGMCSDTTGTSADDKVFWVGNETFKVQHDGTMWATNAYVKGTVSAKAFVGGVSGEEVTDALKKIEIVNLSGSDAFSYYNDNLDGNFTVLPDILRFRILTNALTEEDLTPMVGTSEWVFQYNIVAPNSEDGWETIEINNENNNFLFDEGFMIFTIRNTFAPLQEYLADGSLRKEIYVRVSKNGRAVKYDGNGFSTDTYEDHIYSATLTVRNQDYGVNKFLSLIDPQSYTFIQDNNKGITYADSASFTINLKNIDVLSGEWTIAGESVTEQDIVDANGNNTSDTITKNESIIITDGKWYINDVQVKDGDTVSGNAETSTGDIKIINVDNGDGTGTSTIIIPHSRVPEGGQIAIRYQLGKAVRTAFAFKSRNGADSIIVVLRSSAGVSFINGEGSTDLSAELYFGSQLANNGSTDYYYVWKKDDVAMSKLRISADILLTRETNKKQIFDHKTILVSPTDFGKKANYSCYIFTTVDEAIDEYIKNNDEKLENKSGFE